MNECRSERERGTSMDARPHLALVRRAFLEDGSCMVEFQVQARDEAKEECSRTYTWSQYKPEPVGYDNWISGEQTEMRKRID